jgi:hypothetical protein
MLKYLIDEKLSNLPAKEYDEKIKELITVLDVTKSTFYDWRNLTHKDTRDIPATKLLIISKFFGCTMESLFNPEPARKKEANILKRQKIKL